jgi:hypothetical protein
MIDYGMGPSEYEEKVVYARRGDEPAAWSQKAEAEWRNKTNDLFVFLNTHKDPCNVPLSIIVELLLFSALALIFLAATAILVFVGGNAGTH